jgi:hypothetical protein
MTSLADFSAPLITIGMIQSASEKFDLLCVLITNFRVRANLQNMAPGFDFASSFFLRCLYENESGNPESLDIGFLKGPLLVCVGDLIYIYILMMNQ